MGKRGIEDGRFASLRKRSISITSVATLQGNLLWGRMFRKGYFGRKKKSSEKNSRSAFISVNRGANGLGKERSHFGKGHYRESGQLQMGGGFSGVHPAPSFDVSRLTREIIRISRKEITKRLEKRTNLKRLSCRHVRLGWTSKRLYLKSAGE